MKITIDLKYFIPALIAFALAGMTLTYEIDKYITFAGEANHGFLYDYRGNWLSIVLL